MGYEPLREKPILPGTAETDYERYLHTDELLALQKSGDSANLDWSRHPDRNTQVVFATVAGGEHNQADWKRMLPEFLRWRYGRAPLASPSPLAQAPAQ